VVDLRQALSAGSVEYCGTLLADRDQASAVARADQTLQLEADVGDVIDPPARIEEHGGVAQPRRLEAACRHGGRCVVRVGNPAEQRAQGDLDERRGVVLSEKRREARQRFADPPIGGCATRLCDRVVGGLDPGIALRAEPTGAEAAEHAYDRQQGKRAEQLITPRAPTVALPEVIEGNAEEPGGE